MILRKATEKDISFIIETIVNADKGIHQKLSYSEIFNITEPEFISQLPAMLEEDIQGQEICISDYVICEIDGIPCAACCAWIESEEQESNTLKSTLLRYFFNEDQLKIDSGLQAVLKELHIKRTPNTLQFESVYVKRDARGKGIVRQMFDWHIAQNVKVKNAEIMLTSDNEVALTSYRKFGFEIYKTSETNSDLLPYKGMTLMAIGI